MWVGNGIGMSQRDIFFLVYIAHTPLRLNNDTLRDYEKLVAEFKLRIGKLTRIDHFSQSI